MAVVSCAMTGTGRSNELEDCSAEAGEQGKIS
jgi:hypothetical protein